MIMSVGYSLLCISYLAIACQNHLFSAQMFLASCYEIWPFYSHFPCNRSLICKFIMNTILVLSCFLVLIYLYPVQAFSLYGERPVSPGKCTCFI